MTGVAFGDFDMQVDGCQVTATNVYNPPDNDIQADELAEADGAVIVKQRYTSKKFSVDGWLRAETGVVADFETLLDTFKLALSRRNQAFDIEHSGSVRRYLANAMNMMLSRTSPTSCTFSVEFLSSDGMGWDVDVTTLLAATAVTDASATLAITVGGTYYAEPIITATISSLSASGAQTVTISNGDTLRGITIERTWAASDVIAIDCLNKTVYVNNAVVEFDGLFPKWEAGEEGTIIWADSFTSRTVSITASYTRRWL